MSEQERVQECLRKEIRSLLISAKDGLTPQQLEKEYLLMVGNHLPLRILGYRSTMELVLDMPDVVSVCPCENGTVILKAIPDEYTKGIANLVARQRSSHKVQTSMQKGRAIVCSGPSSFRRAPYRGRVPPILPAVVKSELKDLLALSPVLLSDFEKAFARRFGRSFQYMQYGFLSIFEVLNAASDVISVEQTRAGSLLTLKKSVSEEKQRGWPAGKFFTQHFRMKQEGSYSPGFPVAKARFSQPTSNMEPPKQILNMEKTSKLNVLETSRLNHTEKLNQLENTFKSVIAKIGPGGTINPELKHKIKFVVSKFPEGLLISKLLGEFEVSVFFFTNHASHHNYFNEDREISPQLKQDINDEKTFIHRKSELKKPSKDSEFSSLKTQDKSCKEDPKWFTPKLKDLKKENEGEIPTGMPCLESVTIGGDVWDENWLPLQAKMARGGDAASHVSTSSPGGRKPYLSCKGMPEEDWCFSTPKDMWDGSWQPSALVEVERMKVEVKKPEGLGAQEENPGTTRIQEQPNLKSPSDSSPLPKLEEFSISLIQSQQSADRSQFEPKNVHTQLTQVQFSAAGLNSTPTVVDALEKHSGSVESSPKSLKNEDFSSSHAITVFKDKSHGAVDQLSLILSPEHQISQTFYIPRSTATAALGAAARLATSRSFLHWYPSVKRTEA
ncbi:PREDICTED: tudor domain-containing protein 5 [Hipposideros armiger]|uniref:Tudor domain-containing protein 5 n=1 Tax=Hipposideros armiger TaxID=186990 RepID=A0A8B7QFD9_HIPAR|nr:PREDICTED: tudor domain-containing protein 5 [Hipposideros armiger]